MEPEINIIGVAPSFWAGAIASYGAPVVLIAVLASLISPPLRRVLERTPFATFALSAAAFAAVFGKYIGGLDSASVEGSREGLLLDRIYAFVPDYLFAVTLFVFALALFALAQLRRALFPRPLIRAAELPQRTGEGPERTSWLRGWLDAIRGRSKVAHDFNAAVPLLQRPDFNALAFAIRTAALAGLPASVVATLISVDTLTSADAAGAGTSSAMQMIAVVYDAVRPFEISAVLVFLSWLGSWSLTGGRGSLQAVRRLYLTVDAAVSFWPLMVVALAAALGFPSGANDDWLSSLASDLTRASGADQSLSPDDVDLLRTLIVNLVRASVAAGVWLTPLWLLAIKLLRTPRIVTELAGEDIAGGEAAAVARHAVVFSLVAGLAAAAVISVLMLLGIRLG